MAPPARLTRSSRRRAMLLSASLATLALTAQVRADWLMYAGNPQHTAQSAVASSDLNTIRWSTPTDLNPQYTGTDLYIHYGSPLVTATNTVIVPVKTGANDGFEINAYDGFTGALMWSQPSTYTLPAHDWTLPYSPALTSNNQLIYANAGGTVSVRAGVDSATATTTPLAFYGIANYNANPAAYNSSVFINTPITTDNAGDMYFGFQTTPGNPLGITGGIARITPSGAATFVSASAAAGDVNIVKPAQNCAPALSADGSTVYITVNTNGQTGYLLALNSATLATTGKVQLTDPHNSQPALVFDDASSSPVVGPDGDVYIGTLASSVNGNNDRGFLLHFNSTLTTAKTPGAFGWDDTPSIVPASMVPSYTGSSSYLLMSKYNNYAGIGTGNGVNKIAVLDPNATMVDPVTGATVMNVVSSIAGVTPDSEYRPAYPNAVREWCINSAAIDPATKSILANSEDGTLYRWDMTTNTFTQSIVLTSGTGEAYTPTVIGPDGTVYAINNATLFAVGNANSSIDLSTNSVRVPNGSVATLTARIKGGYNNGTWDGNGITSSVAAEAPGLLALAVVSGSDYINLYGSGVTLNGQTVLPTDALILFTFVGDIDLDGNLTLGDYRFLDFAYLSGFDGVHKTASWINGDLNYDGVVDYQDFALMDTAYLELNGPQAAGPLIALHEQLFGTAYLTALSADEAAIPEPATLALVALGIIPLLTKRRSRGIGVPPIVKRRDAQPVT